MVYYLKSRYSISAYTVRLKLYIVASILILFQYSTTKQLFLRFTLKLEIHPCVYIDRYVYEQVFQLKHFAQYSCWCRIKQSRRAEKTIVISGQECYKANNPCGVQKGGIRPHSKTRFSLYKGNHLNSYSNSIVTFYGNT